MSFIIFYLSFGCGMWAGAWLDKDKNPFGPTWKDALYGLGGCVLFWPLSVLKLLIKHWSDKNDSSEKAGE